MLYPLFESTLTQKRLLIAFASILILLMGILPASRAQMPDYGYYYDQGNAYYKKGELTKAIEMYKRAVPLAQGSSVAIAYNNLATIYMKRGNYVLTSLVQKENALSDFREAHFFMEYAWPEGLDYSSNQKETQKIARTNIQIGYENLGIASGVKKTHRAMAQKLRLQGKFQEAIVEFAKVVELDPKDTEARKALGDLFNVLNRPEKSKKYYQEAVNLLGDQSDDPLLVRLAIAQNKAGEVDNAVASLNRALEANPNNMDAIRQLEDIWRREIKFNPRSVLGHANLASVFQKKKMFGDALKAYDNAERLAGQDPSITLGVKKLIRLNMGTLYQEMRDFPMAHKAYDSVLQIEPGNKLATYYKAVLYKEGGQIPQAIEQYNRLLAIDPAYEEAHGDLLQLIKRQPTSIAIAKSLREYADRYPNNAMVQSKVGEEFHSVKDYQAATHYYRQSIRIKPTIAATHANLGASLQAIGDTEGALAEFKKAAELAPDNQKIALLAEGAEEEAGHAVFLKAVELQKEGKNEEAIYYYQKALEVPVNQTAELRVSYGVALQGLGRFSESIEQYNEAIRLAPNNGNYHYYLATAHHQDSNLPKALLSYHKAIRLESTEPDIKQQANDAVKAIDQAEATQILNKVVDAYNQQLYAQGLNLIDKALKKDPENAMAYYYRALIYKEQKKLTASVSSYDRALKYDPDFKDAYFGLAVVLDEQQNKQRAKVTFQKYLDLSVGTQDDFVKYAQERVKAL